MIDILDGRLFMERDILKIKFGKYSQNGSPCFAISVFLKGSETPEIAIYKNELEMNRDLSLIEKAWKDAMQDGSPNSSILEEFQKMQERLNEIERKLEEWHSSQKAEAAGKQKSQGKRQKPKTEKTTLPRDTAEEEAECADLPKEAKEALLAWLAYKYEKHQPYTKTGFRALITKTQNNSQRYGEAAVADLIGDCMSSGYQGITWDRLKKSGLSSKSQFNEFEHNQYSDDELEDIENCSVV